MRLRGLHRVLVFLIAALAPFSIDHPVAASSGSGAGSTACPKDDSGLKLPPGFCATIFADGIGHARHMVVAPNGVVYVNTWSGDYYPPNQPAPEGGFLVALQDKSGSAKADVIQRFGETAKTGAAGGTGIALYNGSIYAEVNDRIVRYALPPGALVPTGQAVTVVSGLPLGGDHPMHPFVITSDGTLYVDVGTATNACQLKNRQLHSPGAQPCTELETRGGIWKYDAKKTDQKFSPADRYATGIRNGEGFGVDPSSHRLYVTQHGRDQLHANWPELYKPEEEATLPSETVLLLKQGGDYGWPECYYDPGQAKLVLAPEYGGDGGHAVGVCASKTGPVAVTPAHWAPNGMVFYNQKQFPSRYDNGVFIAFHGSWDRAPYAQGGYNIVFQSLAGPLPPASCEVFADGFAGSAVSPEGAIHRPSGVAVGPDGSLYVSDDMKGTIYKITYVGGPATATGPQFTPCPSLTAGAGEIARAEAKPPEGTHPDAGAAALPVPPGATQEMVALGDQIYHGEVAGGTCTACHGENATGSPLGPDLTKNKFLWSDGSWAGITKTITDGVSLPKEYRSPMPAMGGSQLTPEQASAVGAYIWALSHR
ncbi:PQQ-dependent sugar dehydrogenase [Alloacidobacterium dinghuense]|uniref:PQQ-dependent sugar dehydrogenase n=1 Tax=Alloacidobacterium dinghuense TaxID=2763107 RepID=A0A7G8BKP0_9BACT|nr:PQQ-dependent sugar dehydrogenase [Alloacidobacterium dinghuense]QNI33110.1 PQQ-dependent sugar dehydrogenase [Alloacidobacterium dinghuense]